MLPVVRRIKSLEPVMDLCVAAPEVAFAQGKEEGAQFGCSK
jgi:hypothetical protein